MPLPSSGNSISLNQVNTELGLSGTAQISLDDFLVRALFRVSAGQISMSDGYGKTASLDLGFTKNLVIFTADGTAGASNSTFVDSSSSALTLTVTSSSPTTHAKIAPGQGAFSPFLPTSYWSAALNIDKAQAYREGIKLSSQLLIVDSADNCIEWWWNPLHVTTPTTATAFPIFGTDDTVKSYACTISPSSGTITLFWKGSTVLTVTGLANVINGKWTHYAVIKSGTNLYLFIDGQKVGTSSTLTTDGSDVYIQRILGVNPSISGLETHFTPGGYFSNFRIVTGSVVYPNAVSTNTFVVPYTPLTAITGTKLLLFNSSSIRDNSADARALTVVNNFISVISFSPFSNKTPYVAATHGGSASFVKEGLSFIRTQSNSVFGFGTQNFTLEAWVYPDSTPLAAGETERAMRVFWFSDDTGGLEVVWVPGSSVYGALRYFGASPSDIVYGGSPAKVIAGQWNHIAVCRNYSEFKIYAYVNGQYLGNATLGSQISYSSRSCYIGARDTPYTQTKSFYGYISNARVSNIARYTGASTYTIPTGPFTNDANTVFLCKMENAALNDLMSGTGASTNDVTLSTTVKKFGSASLSFQPGASTELDGLYVKPMVRSSIPDGSTYEMWYYATNSASLTRSLLNTPGEGVFTPPAGTTLNTWRHFALSTLLSKGSAYHDGVLTQEFRAASIGDTLSGIAIGNNLLANSADGPNAFLGYIDSVRITQYPRYVGTNTSGFTVPTEAAEPVSERIINVNSIIGIGGSKVFDLDGYRYHVYTASANFYCLKSGTVHAFLVGGGASGSGVGTISVPGGSTNYFGRGGDGGSVTNNTSVSVTAGTSYQIVVGAAGVPLPYPSSGGTTTAFGLSAAGGGHTAPNAYSGGAGAGGAGTGANGGPGAEYAPLRLKFAAGGAGAFIGGGEGGDCGYLAGQFIGGGEGGYADREIDTGETDPETGDPITEFIPGRPAGSAWMFGSGGGANGAAAGGFGAGAGGIVIVRYAL
jgi:hypothetical protein